MTCVTDGWLAFLFDTSSSDEELSCKSSLSSCSSESSLPDISDPSVLGGTSAAARFSTATGGDGFLSIGAVAFAPFLAFFILYMVC